MNEHPLTSTERDKIMASARELDDSYEIERENLRLISRGRILGKWEGFSADDLDIALAIDTITGSGVADQTGGGTDTGLFGARVGRAVLWTDSAGFHRLDVYDSAEDAEFEIEMEEA